MSEIQDCVLAAIDGGARDVDAIEEASGLERQQIYNAVHQLKKVGLVMKGDAGLLRTAEAVGKPNGHDKSETSTATPAPRSRKSASPQPRKQRQAPKGKPRKVPKRGKRTARAAPVKAAQPVIEVARFGEFVVIRRVDLVTLAKLFDAILQWRDAIQAA